jgi:hypothetical protein
MAVESIAERDAIPEPRRKLGMIASVSGDALYTLVGGLDNTNWIKIEIFKANFFTTTENIDGDAGDNVTLDLTLLTPNDKLPVPGDIITDPNNRQARVTDVDETNDEVEVTILEDVGRKPVSVYNEDILLIDGYFVIHNGKLAKIVNTFTTSDEGNIDESWAKDIEDGNLELISDSATIVYENNEFPQLDTVKKALDFILYEELEIDLTGGGTFEIGDEITTLNLAWTFNKAEIESQSLNQGIGVLDPADRSFIDNAVTIDNDVTYTLTANDGSSTATADANFIFRPRRFWGVSPEDTLTDAEVLALDSDLIAGRTMTRTFDATGGNYFYVALPSSYGIPTFRVGGFNYSNVVIETRNVENQFGETIEYNIMRSGLIQTGSAIIVELT